MDSSLIEKRLFTSLHTLKETGESIRRQFVNSELDLNHFLHQTVEKHISKIIEKLYKLEEGIQNIDLRGRPQRRSPHLAAQEQSASSAIATRSPRTPPLTRNNRPRADQFYIYNIPNQSSESIYRVITYIKEYKSSHKVTLDHIYKGLEDIDIDEIIK
ncbi:uncharacterized protein N7506_012324 [Penicillium brevicompactum]|uniref:uncharacterized protein n=1 Tax=Penicillium brevicompactum TaxID=5074 RepID=UPI0025401401|nr:uncharacterized protein N7506_012324 [Penicillium brevicompactum]KAJ5319620.1 hypothetical protein N7506_012324 [Penicillium brevicompactum]